MNSATTEVTAKPQATATALPSAFDDAAAYLSRAGNVLVIDPGNSRVKALVRGELVTFSTKYKSMFAGGSNPRAFIGRKAPAEGIAVKIQDNAAHPFQYLFSDDMAGGNYPADVDKAQFYLPIILGCCAAGADDSQPWTVIFSHWDEPRDNEIINLLKGEYDCLINAQKRTIALQDFLFIPEGAGSDFYARRELGAEGVIALIDVGFNTTGFALYGANGCIERKYRENAGVRQIVHKIINDPSIEGAVGHVPTVDAVIKAIKSAGMLKTTAVVSGNLDISQWINVYSKEWLQRTLGQISRSYGEEIAEADAYFLVGGGAHLLAEAAKGTGIRLPIDPQLTNIKGMVIEAARWHKCVTA